jgi:hypothetical protein
MRGLERPHARLPWAGAAVAGHRRRPERWYGYLEVKCLGCNTNQTVALDIVRRPKATPIHELERYMRCKECSAVRRYAFKRSQLIALRPNKITAEGPASEMWPGERG